MLLFILLIILVAKVTNKNEKTKSAEQFFAPDTN